MCLKNAQDRIRCTELKERLTSPEEAAKLIKPHSIVGCSGFTPSGYPKLVPAALAERAVKEGAIPLTVWTGASVGSEIDSALLKTGCIAKRFPYQTDSDIRKAINSGEVHFADLHLSHNAQNLRYGFYGQMETAIIEALAITEEGNIIPTTSVGNTPVFALQASQIIVEINCSQPEGLEGIHDIYSLKNPPHREPVPIVNVQDRIGLPWISCDKSKIAAIVYSTVPDCQRDLAPLDEVSGKMAENLLDFLDSEVSAGRLPPALFPLQSGVGNIANAVLTGLKKWPADGLTVYTEVLQDAVFELLDSGKIAFASSTALTPSPYGAAKYYPRLNEFKERVILRPQEISNHPEVIRRLGLIAMNTAVEVDIYGHVNSTMAGGTKMLNGIGGSGDFARNAYLTIFLCPSSSPDGKISKIVPFCSHIDHTEHDTDIIVTEYGVADLRNLSPRERSNEIINKCSHPDYKELLRDYKHRSELGKGHEPHIIGEALSWHQRLKDTGSMRPV